MSDAIKYTLANGEPMCSRRGCPSFLASTWEQKEPSVCRITGRPMYNDSACVPGLREQRAELRHDLELADKFNADLTRAQSETVEKLVAMTRERNTLSGACRKISDYLAEAIPKQLAWEREQRLHVAREVLEWCADGGISFPVITSVDDIVNDWASHDLRTLARQLNIEPSEDDDETRRRCLATLRGVL